MRLVLLIFMVILSNFTMAEEFIYRSYSPSAIKVDGSNDAQFDSIVLSDDIDGWMMVKGDAIIAMDIETDSSDWFHIKSEYFSLSFRKLWSKMPKHWVFRGVEYQLIGNSKIEVLGSEVPVTVISYCHSDQACGYVYFSKQNGIMGFTSIEDASVYLSVSHKGFMAK